MSKLKTLKDLEVIKCWTDLDDVDIDYIEGGDGIIEQIFKTELKKEAIKHIKELTKKVKKCECGSPLIFDENDKEYFECPNAVNSIYNEDMPDDEIDTEIEKIRNMHNGANCELIEDIESVKIISKINFIKDFFNITEKDLK